MTFNEWWATLTTREQNGMEWTCKEPPQLGNSASVKLPSTSLRCGKRLGRGANKRVPMQDKVIEVEV